MQKNITKSILLLGSFVATVNGVASTTGKDQASNIARTVKEPEIPLDARFYKGDHSMAVSKKALEGAVGVDFTLRKINLTGHTIFNTQALSALWSPYLNKKISLADVQKIAQLITQKYREAGYVLTQVVLPPQDITPEKGQVTLQVIEGTLGSVRVEGGGASEQKLIKSQLSGFPLGKPFNVNELERHLISIRKTPGLTIQTVLMPSTTKPGSTDLVFKVGATQYANISFGYNNTGNKYTSRHHMSTDLMLYNLVGRSKTALSHLRGSKKDRFSLYRVRQTQLIGDKGTRAYAEFITSQVRFNLPDLTPGLNKSSYKYANIMLMHPLIYKREENLRIRFALDGQNDASTLDGGILKNDHIRAARLGLLYSRAHEADFMEISGILHRGFVDSFGARRTDYPSRYGGTNHFRYASGRGLWVHKFNDYFSSLNMFGWQYSRDPLLSTEEFGVGASNYARGYNSTESTADCGLGALTEMRLNTPVSIPGINSLQFYTSFGGSRVRNHKEKISSQSKESLLSFAYGIRSGFLGRFNCTLQAGKPLARRMSIRETKKWNYTATIGMKFNISKDWDKMVKAPDDPLGSIDE